MLGSVRLVRDSGSARLRAHSGSARELASFKPSDSQALVPTSATASFFRIQKPAAAEEESVDGEIEAAEEWKRATEVMSLRSLGSLLTRRFSPCAQAQARSSASPGSSAGPIAIGEASAISPHPCPCPLVPRVRWLDWLEFCTSGKMQINGPVGYV